MIKSVRLTNFFSFRDCEITLEPDVTVLVGINGSGKTNLLRAFELLKAGMEEGLREKVSEWGGGEAVLNKSKVVSQKKGLPSFEVQITFQGDAEAEKVYGAAAYPDECLYEIEVFYDAQIPQNFLFRETLGSADGELVFLNNYLGNAWTALIGLTREEAIQENSNLSHEHAMIAKATKLGMGVKRQILSNLPHTFNLNPITFSIADHLKNSSIYSDFDTRPKSPMRNSIQATGLDVLDPDGGNLFQILNTIQLKSTEAGDAIERDLQAVNPNFERLQFQPLGQGGMLTYLREVGLKTPIPAAHVSDGTLRYLCLLAIAHNPDRGRLICLDEPERGLHPDMLAGVARLLLDDGHANPEAPRHTSYVVATHSPQLLSHFPLRCLRVFEKDENNQTVVRQFSEEQFKEWYDSFDAGSMWMKGDLGGTRY